MRVRLSRRFGDNALVVDSEVGAAPKAQARTAAEAQRICRVVLWDAVDAGFPTDVVIGVSRKPEPVRQVPAYVLFDAKDGILRERSRHQEIIVVGETSI